MASTPQLDPNEILRAEYDYAAQSAFQANEDRARVTSFYILSVSSLVAAILGAKFLEGQYDSRTVNFGFGGLFFLLTVLGFLTLIQLARLRAAWYGAAQAMNKIKNYYIDQFQSLKLGDAFLWKTLHAVPKFKPNSVSFFLALEMSMLSAVTFGASIFFFGSGFSFCASWLWPITITLGLVVGFVQIVIYYSILIEKKK